MNMNLNLTDEIEVINSAVAGKKDKVVIWGAGMCAEDFLNHTDFTGTIDYFTDGNEKKWNTIFHNKKVYSIERFIQESNENTIVLIATMYIKDVIEKLKSLEYKGYVYSAFHVVFGPRCGVASHKNLEKQIGELKRMLSDSKSKDIVEKILKKRQEFDLDYSDICEPHQYFVKEIMDKDTEAVFIDGGAYLGETIEEFIEFQNNKFKKVYSFEMDINNYKKMNASIYDDRVKLLNYGLWNEETECTYDADATSSAIGEGGANIAKCTTIDKICMNEKVTFIKMDIEGSEMAALEGAYQTIVKNKPQLAICVYHKPDDIYEIPFLLKKWVPEYKFYIRHHSERFTETVLYAKV